MGSGEQTCLRHGDVKSKQERMRFKFQVRPDREKVQSKSFYPTKHLTMMMMSSTTSSGGGSIRTMSTFTTLLLISLSCCAVSPVISFLLPRQQSPLQHQPPILSYQPINSDGQRPSLLLLNQSPKSQEGQAAATASTQPAAAGTSKRAQRKAAQRAKKQRQQNTHSKNTNKATSQHPEAIIKRQKQQQQQGGANSNKRRNHNFAQRAEYLSEGIDSTTDYGFHDNLDGLTLTQTIDSDNNNNNEKGGNIQFHQLHSQKVSKLDESTTADDVVKAIKRAQNLHDVHDVVEIAHFLLEEVGEYDCIIDWLYYWLIVLLIE